MPPRSGSRASPRLRALGLAILGALAACTPGALPAPRGAGTRPEPAGTIRLAYPDWPSTLNPVTEASPGARDILRAVLPSFHIVTPDLEYRPSLLAEEPRVEVEDDRMEVAFRIRDGALWSDGTPITVRDVAFTAEVMVEPEVAAVDPEGFDHLVDVVQDSPTAGRLVLSPPLEGWRELFSTGRFVLPAHAASSPAAVAGWDRGPPLAGGPFRIEEVVPGRSVMLERNDRYFGPRPLAERIEVAAVPDPTTAIQLLRDGKVDVVAPMLGVSWGRRLGALPGVQSASASGPDLVALVANAARLPDAGERRALADAVDRVRFADAVVRDEGTLAHSLVAPGLGGGELTWAHYGRGDSPELSAGEELELVYVRTELLELTARYLQAEVQRAGGDLELVGLESDVFWDTFLPERRFDLALVEVRRGPTPDLGEWFGAPDGIWSSLTGHTDPELALLEDDVAAGVPGAVAEAQARLADLAVVVPLYRLGTSMGWRQGVTGIEPNPSADGPLWNAQEWSKPEV
jgi:peptide/nickel transport system substrate-binding protein